MRYSWTSSKRELNLRKHGLDFADASLVFDGPTLTLEDTRDYGGEQRFNTIGILGMTVVTICHTETENEIHVISMRKAEPYEIEILSRYL